MTKKRKAEKRFYEIVSSLDQKLLLSSDGITLCDGKVADREIICSRVYGDYLIACWCKGCYNSQKCEAKSWEWEKRLKKSTWMHYAGWHRLFFY